MGVPRRDGRHHTYGAYRTWLDEERYELIEGVAYLRSPAPNLEHQEVVGEVYRQVANAQEGATCRALVSPVDVRLPDSDEDDEDIETVVQPDVLVVCDEAKLDHRGVKGSPDWIVEVLSPATASHDQI